MSEDYDRFILWYRDPLVALEKMPSGQGGFIALATACFLYERYAVAFIKSQARRADRAAKVEQLRQDFDADGATASAFWSVVRDGVLHQGMPKQAEGLPQWGFHHSYPPMMLDSAYAPPFLKIQPWKFTARVLELWESHFELLRSSGSFPWATIGDVPA